MATKIIKFEQPDFQLVSTSKTTSTGTSNTVAKANITFAWELPPAKITRAYFHGNCDKATKGTFTIGGAAASDSRKDADGWYKNITLTANETETSSGTVTCQYTFQRYSGTGSMTANITNVWLAIEYEECARPVTLELLSGDRVNIGGWVRLDVVPGLKMATYKVRMEAREWSRETETEEVLPGVVELQLQISTNLLHQIPSEKEIQVSIYTICTSVTGEEYRGEPVTVTAVSTAMPRAGMSGAEVTSDPVLGVPIRGESVLTYRGMSVQAGTGAEIAAVTVVRGDGSTETLTEVP